ncbi:hypothetical protein D9M70_421430 [compost metagenome]
MRPDMIELLDRDGFMFLDCLNHLLEVGNDAIVRMPEVAAGENGCGMHGHGFDDNHRGPADRALPVIGGMAFGRQALDGHVCGVGAEHDPVLQRVRPQFERGE